MLEFICCKITVQQVRILHVLCQAADGWTNAENLTQ